MPLFACGINYKTAPLILRERLVFDSTELEPALQQLLRYPSLQEAAILSTCNRTEIYGSAPSGQPLVDWLAQRYQLSPSELEKYFYYHEDTAAVQHLMRVASGLDSMVLGEPQIFGQMKTAYLAAEQTGAIGPLLSRLFQCVFATTKQIRTDTAIGQSAVSVAYVAVSLAKKIFSDLQQTRVLLIGAGETIELVATHLYQLGVKQILIANRSSQRAATLQKRFAGQYIALGDVPNYISEVDMVFSSTASPLPILGKGSIERALQQRHHRGCCLPILMVDLAVPRDIEPEVSELSDIYLYNIDDLKHIAEQGCKNRQAAAKQAEEIIALRSRHFMRWKDSRDGVSTIKAYHERAYKFRQHELSKAKKLLNQGVEVDEVLERFADALISKLTHHPTVHIKETAAKKRDDLMHYARQLLGID